MRVLSLVRHAGAVLVVGLSIVACSGPPPPAPPPPAPVAPPVKDAVVAIYTAFAKNPAGFDRGSVLSRFYMSDNAAIDADCAAGKDHPRCHGDRFACLPALVKGAGVVQDAVVKGEQPGVSASVKVTLAFGATVVSADVDVAFEDGAWKVDQVRCELPPAE